MAGSLKATCATNARVFALTPTFGSLNAQTKFTMSCWLQIGSVAPGTVNTGLAYANNSTFEIDATSYLRMVAVSGTGYALAYQLLNTQGHFIVISYDGSGTTTIYLDGTVGTTAPLLGLTISGDTLLVIGVANASPAIVLYLKDLALWSGFAATQADVFNLRDGVYTPGTLVSSATSTLTPATNWWTLQGPPGAVTAGTQGLADSIGGVNFGTITADPGAAFTYDAHEITLSFSAKMMTPYCDVTGNLIFIPLYIDPASNADGGPATPTLVNVPPVFKRNGTVFVPTPLAIDPLFYAIIYQMPSGVSVAPGDTLTMAAPLGWASTTVGVVEGTSAAGFGSGPMTVTNYAGQNTEFPFTRTMKMAYNGPTYGNAYGAVGQPKANYASRLLKGDPLVAGGWAGGGVLTWDPVTQLPATISAQVRGVLSNLVYNLIDNRRIPSIEGLWTLVYGDSTPGVTSNPSTGHMITVQLAVSTSWNWVENPNGTDSPGTWDSVNSQWTGITRTYQGSYLGSGNYGNDLVVLIDSVASGGQVRFPDKGNGQVELGVFPPSPSNRNVSSPTTWDPMAADPEYLQKHQGAAAIRWMGCSAGMTFAGDSSMLTVADLAQRQVIDFLWTRQTYTKCNVIKVDPLGATWDTIIDYQGGVNTMSVANFYDAGSRHRVSFLCTTDADHAMRTGDIFTINPTTTAPAPRVKQDGMVLTSAIASSGSPVTFTVNTTLPPPLAAGDLILIGSEQLTVSSVSGSSVTATRGTPAAHAIGAVVYINFLTAAISTTTGPTSITLSRAPLFLGNNYIQIDSEQMFVTSIDSPTTATVNRAVNGTTGATHTNGSVVYPCVQVTTSLGFFGCVTGPRTFVLAGPSSFQLPFTGDPFITNPTIQSTVNYTPPDCPTYTINFPNNNGSVPYEFAAKMTNDVALASGRRTICWINVALLVTDALVTEIIANRVIPYIGSLVDVILELSNETWNFTFPQSFLATILYSTAPNPDPPNTPYAGVDDFLVSRQQHVTMLAKAAFTAAGLDPDRVYYFQPGHHQISQGQGVSQARIAYCQAQGFPVDLMSMDAYNDITSNIWNLWWTWMPIADGGPASWSRATARRMMMSYWRSWCWYSQFFGGAIMRNAQILSWYNAGKSVAGGGVGVGTANTRAGRLCFYEAASEIAILTSSFVHAAAMEEDLIYDGIPQWAGDTGWASAEEGFHSAAQGAAARYASLMPVAAFPDLPSADVAFMCYFSTVGQMGGNGEAWFLFNWQGQPPGPGVTNLMSVPDATPWSTATPVAQSRQNQSIRGKVAIDWIANTPTPTPTLTSIAVTPPTPTITNGATQQFTATGIYSDGSTLILTNVAIWSSLTTAVATIDANGLASSVGVGTSPIVATFTAIVGSTLLTVTAATLTSITVTPVNPSIAGGLTQQFAAIGTYSDSSMRNITNLVTWVSADLSVATITIGGLATGIAVGTSSITATLDIVVGSTTLTVTAAILQSISVTPSSPTITNGATQQFTATGTYSDTSTQNLTSSVTWMSLTPSIATISVGGLATSVAAGTSTIMATLSSISGVTTLTVTAATLRSIAVTPINPSIASGTIQQFTATGTYSDSTTQPLSSQVIWASFNTGVATIASSGIATGVSVGTSSISATLGIIAGSTVLTVTAATLRSIVVTPANPNIIVGRTQQFTATGTYSDSTMQNVTNLVTWTSVITSVATIDATGLATGVGLGVSSITAALGLISSSTAATVIPVTPTPTPTSEIMILDPQFGMTPLINVANTVERNALPMPLRVSGMVCYTSSDRATWRLLQGPWAMADSDWTNFP